MTEEHKEPAVHGVAIIGAAGRFPGASTLEQFWDRLAGGRESVTFFKEPQEGRVHAAGLLEQAAEFDAAFFGMSPREAEVTDPQHRVFLECAYEAMEAAGYPPVRCTGRVGVYAGSGQSGYLKHVESHPEIVEALGAFQSAIGSGPDFLTTRVSYKLNLRGPSIAVQTACSSSLVAVHLACQALLTHECDMALAGGVSVKADQTEGFDYQEGGILSPDGHCRAFDAQARGTVVGNGGGAVLLKRLEDALSDGDTVLAVIRGTAVNNDGAHKIGYTAPSVGMQSEVIREALQVAEVDASTVTYVEAHGTGTVLGDPIEVAALTDAYRFDTDQRQYCALGSVKTNLGHLDSAAGIAGLIKTVLCLKHRMLPPSLHFREANPEIDLAGSPFYVNSELRPWLPAQGYPLRAGVSSFGMGGTNAHVILEEAPAAGRAAHEDSAAEPHLFVLSARTDEGLLQRTRDLIAFLEHDREAELSDIAYTLAAGREAFGQRLAVTASTREELLARLGGRVMTSSPAGIGRKEEAAGMTEGVIFLFSGQGSQHPGMGADLYRHAPVYRSHLDRCAELAVRHTGTDVRRLLFPEAGREDLAAAELRQTVHAQPALFSVEWALAKQLEAWGIGAEAMIGHSIGEFTAACLAGVMSLEDAMKAVCRRAQLMQELEKGAMTAVQLPEQKLLAAAASAGVWISVAAVNVPDSCVAAGTMEEIERLEASLNAQGIAFKRLQTSHAFHSHMMEGCLEAFAEVMRGIRMEAPRVPYISNVTGTWIAPEDAVDPQYWVMHLRRAVRFAEGIQSLAARLDRAVYLEVGPGQALASMVKGTLGSPEAGRHAGVYAALPSAGSGGSAYESLLQAVGALWCAGAADPAALYRDRPGRRVPLPTYPFERQTYYLPKRETAGTAAKAAGAGRRPMEEWFYAPVWKMTPLPVGETAGKAAGETEPLPLYLLFADQGGLAGALREELVRRGGEVVMVLSGEGHAQEVGRDGPFVLASDGPQAYEELLRGIRAAFGRLPDKIVHLWNTDVHSEQGTRTLQEDYQAAQRSGLYSLISLAQALGMQEAGQPVELIAVTSRLLQVAHEPVFLPERATLLGALRVMPQEYGHLRTRVIDVESGGAAGSHYQESARGRMLLGRLANEIGADASDFVTAYRGPFRYTPSHEEVRLPGIGERRGIFRSGGVYLVTGAAGGMGLPVCEAVAREVQASFILLGDPSFPPPEAWDACLEDASVPAGTRDTITRIRALEASGSRILYASPDLTDEHQTALVLQQAEARFGRMDGVLFASEPYSSGLIQWKDPARTGETLAPHVLGLTVLSSLLRDRAGFMVLFSRTISVTGGIGQLDLCAYGSFLDAWARAESAAGVPVVSISWSMWQEDVWLERMTGIPQGIREKLENLQTAYGLSAGEGVPVIEGLAASGLPQAVVSTQDLEKARHSWASLHESDGTVSPAAPYPGGPAERTAPRNEVERTLAGMWEAMFGVSGIGIYQNFFELGGNSLHSIQLVARLRQTFHGGIPMDILFQSPTIAELAEAVASTQADREQLEEIERLLREVEAMSQEELMQELEKA
ncbi:JamP [Paenibacillus mucilaginosus 3016]|uniref:Phenolphthiocerol/phthiocerol polyketide synthase subunit E n=1 Tax=Paenibacillus mucilaginosus 3016 TaxID=1116391 RepID=H6NMZ3_9BACL|nr:type I polyketide synthase [Paenibacillus mucilaginosus]AFC31033.1 JamP [Paenibacillus mucilaginosus 3016]WFA19619.1 type I polyketide synthase [Paenibacillus mucilaginosus]